MTHSSLCAVGHIMIKRTLIVKLSGVVVFTF